MIEYISIAAAVIAAYVIGHRNGWRDGYRFGVMPNEAREKAWQDARQTAGPDAIIGIDEHGFPTESMRVP